MREAFEVIGFAVVALVIFWGCLAVGDGIGRAVDALRERLPR